ncbi:unnamed protein product [Ilex paraguariensis]|uniref:Clp R domain-containing protein n=1 Tax=Ilex paraguariensis TaxID=185542 RepID=A0ABC8TVN4_9AQUA
MPTPVNSARQCLTSESAQALDDAVVVARRRGHAQTTSLHMVSALLSLPSSPLREACTRARNNAYSTRIQFKALELCLSVSLDRSPSSPTRVDEPPISNSLMAAIKRSQANQRRQPENFNLYQQQQQLSSSSSSMSVVKVELQNFIMSILDDPVVSRVFGEAGIRSCDIKLAILRPVHQLFGYSRYKGPPMFLCNFAGDSELGSRGFSFPFLGFPGFFESDESSRRIGEVLVRNKGRNPLLVGACANDALRSFLEMVQRRRGGGVLPVELSGLVVICVENEILKFVSEDCDKGLVKLRTEEVGRMVEHCIGPGVVVNFGDLKTLVGDDASVDAVRFVVHELVRLLEIHSGKVWLIGATARYETYLKFLSRFPSFEKDWDLQLLPITSLRHSMRESYPRSRSSIIPTQAHHIFVCNACGSLMESFVPFGGLFSNPSDIKSPLSISYPCVSRHLCNEKCEQEITALSKGGFISSISDQCQSSLPSWLQTAELSTSRGSDILKAKDDSMILSAKVAGLQSKGDNSCQRRHFICPKTDTYHVNSQVPAVVGFQVVENRKENVDSHSNNNLSASSTGSGSKNKNLSMSIDMQQSSTSKSGISLGMVSMSTNVNLSKVCEKPSQTEDGVGGLKSPPWSLSSSSVGNCRSSPASAVSVTTDLGLGMYSASTRKELEKPKDQIPRDLLRGFSSCFSANFDAVRASMSNPPAQSSSCSCPDLHGQIDLKDFKMLSTALSSRYGQQEEAVSVISQTISHCRTENVKHHGAGRGDIWFNFVGPDRFGKRRIAVALAEIVYGNRENFICVDLSFQDGMILTNSVFGHQEMTDYDVKFRGKTVVDYIAEKLSKKPLSVVFLENIDKADPVVHNSLSQAVRTGRFSDSHGREVSIGNAIFVTTSGFNEFGKTLSYMKETTDYSEEQISRAQAWPIQMLIGFDLGDDIRPTSRVLNITRDGSNLIFMNKRKLIGTNNTVEQCESLEMAKRAHKTSNVCLDLNLPAEDSEICDADIWNPDSDTISENSKAWLEDFSGQVDATVVFKPFDFDALAANILKEISECFHQIVGLECLLEIDSKVMKQILAAACLLNNNSVKHWVQKVLSKGFVEAKERYDLTPRSVVKLITCEGLFSEEQVPGVLLPPRIIMN